MTHLHEGRPTPAAAVLATDGPAAAAQAGACLRLVVVDADDRTRESLVGLLGIRDRFRVVGSAGDAQTALASIRAQRPDVVVLDPRLPEPSGGISLIRAIHATDPAIRVLAVGWSPELERESLGAGADGFVRKTFRPSELADAIGRCMGSCEPGPVDITPGIDPDLE
jgi:DNA-binding NarL/FixJ family response regulator